MDAPITDPTLAAYHSLPGEAERPYQRIYFASIYTPSGELRMRQVIEPTGARPAELKIDVPPDSEQGDG